MGPFSHNALTSEKAKKKRKAVKPLFSTIDEEHWKTGTVSRRVLLWPMTRVLTETKGASGS